MKVITVCFGQENHHFLAVFLESIRLANGPSWNLTVLTDSDASAFLTGIMLEHPDVEFIETPNSYSCALDPALKPSMKLRHWIDSLQLINDNEYVLFLDVDMIVREKFDVGSLAKNIDIFFTLEEGSKWPLNVGFIAVNKNHRSKLFLERWLHETNQILANTKKVDEASEKAGAPDQYAMTNIINNNSTQGRQLAEGPILIEIESLTLQLYGLPSYKYNFYESKPVSHENKILHFKGGWKAIINNDGVFTKNRPASTSYQMYSIWQNLYISACKKIARTLIYSSTNKLNTNDKLVKAISNEPYQSRGILNSEIFALIALGSCQNVTSVVESGRARGHSTLMLAKYLNGGNCNIASVDLVRDQDALYAESKLTDYSNIQTYYGDSFRLVPRLCNQQKQPYFLLIDGPKGGDAFELAKLTLQLEPPPAIIFIHDLKDMASGKLSPSRFLIDKYFDCVFFTDETKYVSETSSLDVISSHAPFKKDEWVQNSYGPTLAVIIPNHKDIYRAKSKDIKLSILSTLYNAKSLFSTMKDTWYSLKLALQTKSI